MISGVIGEYLDPKIKNLYFPKANMDKSNTINEI
jgi:hypothetical protein|uniref:Uncharacterized protein n=1 Tax=Sphingobacterium sp. (strain 21) TaxID=743722 RepID=F4CA72_SPHS2